MDIRLPSDKFAVHTITFEQKEIGQEHIKQQAHELFKLLFNDCPSSFFHQLKDDFANYRTAQLKPELETWFNEFYSQYPRKINKKTAFLRFKNICTSDKMFGKIMDGLAKYRVKWTKDGTEKQFIPHPSTWLNQRRWEDEEIQKVTMNEALNDMERIFGKGEK